LLLLGTGWVLDRIARLRETSDRINKMGKINPHSGTVNLVNPV